MTPADFRNWRMRLGFTQEELARRLGRCRSGISKIEQGRFGDVDTVMVLAMRALEAGLDGEAPEPKAPTTIRWNASELTVTMTEDGVIEVSVPSIRSAATTEGDPQP